MAKLALYNQDLYVADGYVVDGYVKTYNIYGDYVLKAISRLTSQFDLSILLQGLVAAIVKPLDELQGHADSIKSERWIDTAIGKQLDGCGYIVGEMRQGRDDDAYREALRFRVFVNISKGTPSALIQGLKFLTSPSDVQYIEQYPATAILFTNGPIVPTEIQSQIQDLSPAGISDVPVCVSYTAKPFRFAKTPPPGELFVNMKQDYLTANGADITVSTGAESNGSATLGGIAPADLSVNGYLLDINGLYSLAVHSSNHQTMLDSGYHATGVLQ